MAFRIVRTPFPVYIRTKAEAEHWLQYFYETAYENGVGFDTETTGLDNVNDRVRFFSFANRDARICGPLRLLKVFAPLLEDPHVEKRMSNAKYDQHMTYNHGIQVWGHIQDTIDQDFLYDENRLGRHKLKVAAEDHLGLRMTPFKKIFGDVGSTENEVKLHCHVHDILEENDVGDPRKAYDMAVRVMIRLRKVDAEPEILDALRKLDLSIRGGYRLNARKLLVIARKFGFARKTAGKGGYVSDIVEYLGGPRLPDYKERPLWKPFIEREDSIQDMHDMLWSDLLSLIDIEEDPVEQLRTRIADYASLDSWASYMLVDRMRDLLDQEEMVTEGVEYDGDEPITLLEHSEETRVPFVQTLWNMERRGFAIDVEQTEEYADEMQEELDDIERAIVKLTGDLDFNVNSTHQLREAFYTKAANGKWTDPFGDPPKVWTSGGVSGVKLPSTKKEVLETWAGKGDQLAQLVVEHRHFRKLHDDYMVGLPKWADHNNRIHTSLNSGGARTWRLSSNNPNLQNIPIRDEVWGPRIRSLFVAGLWGDCVPSICLWDLLDVEPPDLPPNFPMTLLVADYRQVEMKILAHFSQDLGMLEAINNGLDIHCQTVALASARGVKGVPSGVTYEMAYEAKKAEDPTKEQQVLVNARRELKATGFGLVYGIGALKLGMQLGLPIVKKRTKSGRTRDWCPVAQDLIDDYLHQIYPGVGQWIQDTHDICREDLVVYTVAGHPRRLPDIISNDGMLRSAAERQAPNSRIQGSAADICNAAMLRCESDPVLRKLGVRLLLQIHDELVFEVPDTPEFVEPAKRRIKDRMENPFPMRVSIDIDIASAKSWGEAKG